MKKILLFLLAACTFSLANAQSIKASIGVGSQVNRIKLYLKTDVSQASSLSSLQFNVGVEATGITTAPTLSVVSSAFGPGVTWTVVPGYLEGGYWNYNIFTSSSPLTPTFSANTDFEAMELEFANGVPNMATVGLVTLPDGGAQSGAVFLCNGTLVSDGVSNLYYARTGSVTVDNQNSYDLVNGAPGSGTSIATIPSIVLPVRFLNFSVSKNNNTALLNWSVELEDANTASYEIQRSLSGVDFTTVATVAPLNNGRTSNTYSFTQESLSSIRNAGVIYFRIKQIDRDGKFVYTPIRSVRLDGKGLVFGVFPNPVKATANVSFDLEENQRVVIKVIDAAGKQVVTSQIQGFKGANITKVEMGKLAAGSYTMSMQAGEEVKTITVVKANQ